MSMERRLVFSGQFSRDVKKAVKRHKDMDKLKFLVALLAKSDLPLPESYRDHPLQGRYSGYRDAHIEPDWLLIYRVSDGFLLLQRTGTHSDLF